MAEEEDIEDVLGQQERVRSQVVPKRSRAAEDAPVGDNIPATERVFIRTWGCSHNNSDSEYMAGLLAASGFIVSSVAEDADVWILNSCTVKTPSEDNFMNAIKEAHTKGKHVVVAGCVPQAQPRDARFGGYSIVGVQQIDRVAEVVEETLKGNVVHLLDQKTDHGRKSGGAPLNLPKIRKNKFIEIVPINTGCLNSCTYCKTKHARGTLGSYPINEIVERIQAVVAEGVVEIWMTSEDTGAYGRDINTALPEMLRAVVAVLPEGTMLRLGMTNPPYIREHLEAVAEILRHPRVYSFLHIPIQSASDEVLAAMRREYTQADFRFIVDYLRAHVPGINIATDIIAAFPGETDDDFEQTVKLVKDYQFPSLFINQFYARPGTPAALMPRVPAAVAKQRTRELSSIFRSYSPYENRVGQVFRVLVTEVATDGAHYVGHTKAYEQVLVPLRDDLLGRMVDVRVTIVGKFYMIADVISEPGPAPVPLVASTRLGPRAAAGVASLSSPFVGSSKQEKEESHDHDGAGCCSASSASSAGTSESNFGASVTGALVAGVAVVAGWLVLRRFVQK